MYENLCWLLPQFAQYLGFQDLNYGQQSIRFLSVEFHFGPTQQSVLNILLSAGHRAQFSSAAVIPGEHQELIEL